MGLFSSKKEEKKQDVSRLNPSDFPDFPEFPSNDDLPKYESSFSDIKNAVGSGVNMGEDSDFEVPVRKKVMAEPQREMVSSRSEFTTEFQPQSFGREDKPLFVKITTYKEAMQDLKALKMKLGEAEDVLRELEDLMVKENSKLDAWKRDMELVKGKLSSVERDLFEV